MITTDVDRLTDAAGTLQQAATAAMNSESPDEMGFVERQLSIVEGLVREAQQKLWASEAQTAIQHLERDEPLTENDLAVIRAFLISDAERYLLHENNYRDWAEELSRLSGQIARRAERFDRESVADLRGVIKDAVRLVPDIRNFLDEKRRVQQFEGAMETLDKPSRQMMARVLREQLSSPNR